jgi:hypothetical protein
MERQELKDIGFKEIPHFTIGHTLIYDIGRNRYLSISNVSNPNEIMFVCQDTESYDRKATDVVVIHNYDYDGYITLEKVKSIVEVFSKK